MTLWSFRRVSTDSNERAAARESLRIEPAFLTNDGSTARYWAEQDLGLVLRSEWDVADSLARGTLVRVLEQWRFDNAPVMLLVPTRKGRSARVQALLQFFDDILGRG
jgi:DNA-binding transcriptional LysR family regulator